MKKRKRRDREDETGVVVLPPADAGSEMGLDGFLADIGKFAEDGNLNLIAKEYERFSKERGESLRLQETFEGNMRIALGICISEKRVSAVTAFLANSLVPEKIKRGADRFLLEVVEEYVKAGDGESLVSLLRACSLPEEARDKAHRALRRIEDQSGKAFTRESVDKGRAAPPTFLGSQDGSGMRRPASASKRFPLPNGWREKKADATTIPPSRPPSRITPLKK